MTMEPPAGATFAAASTAAWDPLQQQHKYRLISRTTVTNKRPHEKQGDKHVPHVTHKFRIPPNKF
jgi:hypothetical protein